MSSTWYYKLGPIVAGPISDEELRAKIAAGALAPDALVRPDSDQDWVPASSIGGLLATVSDPDPIEALAQALSEPPEQIPPVVRSTDPTPKGRAMNTEKPAMRYHSGFLIFSAGILLGIYLGGSRYDYHQVHSSNTIAGSTTRLIRVDRLTGKTQKLDPQATGWYDITPAPNSNGSTQGGR